MNTTASLATRPPAPEDESFLFKLYASTRAREWALLDRPEAEKEELMEMQFRLQAASYTSGFPNSEHSIVLVDDAPAGRIWIDEGPREIKILDISVLPEFQGRGIGTQLLQDCQERARTRAKPLRHSVLRWNSGAISLYFRLGFVPCGHDEFFLQLEWLP
jgi:ribosomal protein S18 acetylase RimI-like enzyme